MDKQINVCLCVCLSFQVLTQLGGYTNSRRKKRNASGGQLRSIYPIYSSWGVEKDKIADSSADHCQNRNSRIFFYGPLLFFCGGACLIEL